MGHGARVAGQRGKDKRQKGKDKIRIVNKHETKNEERETINERPDWKYKQQAAYGWTWE